MLYNSSIAFPYLFSRDNERTEVDTNFTSINRSIALILLTGKGELVGNPAFGSNLKRYQFSEVTEDVKALLTDEIIQSVMEFENRIVLNNSMIDISQSGDRVHIRIGYILKNSSLTGVTDVIYPINIPTPLVPTNDAMDFSSHI